MPKVWFGNPQAIERVLVRGDDGNAALDEQGIEQHDRVSLDGDHWTEVDFADGPVGELMPAAVADFRHLWPYHSDAAAPSWVASADPKWATALAAVFDCPIQDAPGVS